MLGGGELKYDDENRFVASNAEFQEWQRAESDKASSRPHFICECFFMTARALHLSLGKLAESLGNGDARSQQQLQGMLRRGDGGYQQQQIQTEVRYRPELLFFVHQRLYSAQRFLPFCACM